MRTIKYEDEVVHVDRLRVLKGSEDSGEREVVVLTRTSAYRFRVATKRSEELLPDLAPGSKLSVTIRTS
jgi:hypothetical protein